MGGLIEDVFVRRSGGDPLRPGMTDTVEAWIARLRPPIPVRARSDPRAQRGEALFETAGCARCHGGVRFTNSHDEDVGTRIPLQVPSLIGVAHRAPFMHCGCAATLRDSFDGGCGGAVHQAAAGRLSDDQLTDLVADLESL